MSTYTIIATSRKGPAKAKNLLKEGFIPAVVYGHNFKTQVLQVPQKEFLKIYREAGSSQLISLQIDGKALSTLVHEVQKDPVSHEIIHVDFYHITKGQKVTALIPLVFEGVAPGVKDKGGTLITHMREIEIEGLPEKLPASLAVDISSLEEFGDEIKVSDLKLPEGVQTTVQPEVIVAALLAPAPEEQSAPQATEEAAAQAAPETPDQES